jgi:hypothetical protein
MENQFAYDTLLAQARLFAAEVVALRSAILKHRKDTRPERGTKSDYLLWESVLSDPVPDVRQVMLDLLVLGPQKGTITQ